MQVRCHRRARNEVSTHLVRARLTKAITLETYARIHHLDVGELRNAPIIRRNEIASAAQVNPPSVDTWNLMLDLLTNKPLPEEYR